MTMGVLETKTRTLDGVVVSASERRLYTLDELRDEKHIEDEPSDIITRDVSGAYERALGLVSQDEAEIWEWDDADYLWEVLDFAGITVVPREHQAKGRQHLSEPSYDVSYQQGSMWFTLPQATSIDAPKFLRAMKEWAAGRPWLPRSYDKKTRAALTLPRPLGAIDLRGKDYVIIREQGLVLTQQSAWGGGSYRGNTTFDDDYQYDDVSDATKESVNEFLRDITHWCMTVVRDDYEFRTNDKDYMHENAEMNEWLFTKEGKFA